MRVIVNDYSGHPFQVELSRELAARKHDVLHLFSADFQTPKGELTRNAADPQTFAVEGVSLGVPFQKYNFIKRRGQEIAYSDLIRQRIDAFQPDIVIGCNNPLDAQNRIAAACHKRHIPFVFWLQDIYSDAIKSILTEKLSVAGSLIGRWYQGIEKRLLRTADHVVAISDDFIPRLEAWSVKRSNISVIENWAPKDKIPVLPRHNAWAEEHGLTGKKVVLYTGTIGLKHNPDLILAAAEAFTPMPDVQVIVTSEGKYALYLEQEAIRRCLPNLTLLPFQPFERYSEVLATGDVLIAMIEPDAAAYSVPSKVLSYLCSGKPIVLAADNRNLAAKILERAGAGKTVHPHDPAAFTAALSHFLANEKDRARAGVSARTYAEKTFDVKAIADKFESILAKNVSKPLPNNSYLDRQATPTAAR